MIGANVHVDSVFGEIKLEVPL